MASGKIKGITVEIGGDTTKLGKALADVEKNSNSLKGELKQVEKLLKMDPGNTELLAQKQEILTRAVSETTEKLNTLKEAQEQVEKQFKNGDIGEDQYRAFQRELIKTSNELNDFEGELKDTEEALEKAGKGAKESKEGFTIMKGALADLVANAIQGAVSAIGDFIGSILELSEATEEYRTMQAKLEGSSESFGYSVDFAKSKYEEFYKYLGDDQAATNAITNLMGLGTSTENVSSLANSAIAVWSAYGDSIPIEGLTEALNETAQVGKVTGSLADALNWAGISEDDFNAKLEKCSSTQERADLIAKTLNDTYGDSKTKYDELNKSVMDTNESELRLKETQAQLGEAVTPVNNALSDLKNQALQAMIPLVESLANKFMNLYEWLQKHPVAIKIITGVVIALASAFTVLAGTLAIQGIITGVTKAFAFLNTTLLANPIVLITALIAGLVAGIIYLWNNCEAFREFLTNLWNVLKTKTSEVINAIVTYFRELPGKIWSAIVGAISNLESWGSQLVSKAKSAMSNVASAVVNGLKSVPSSMASIGKNIVEGLWNGIKNATSWITNKVKSFAQTILGGIKSALGIKSPSRVFRDEVGKFIAEGIGVGITDNADDPIDALKELGDDMASQELAINGATINRQLSTTFTNDAVANSADTALLRKLDGIYDKLSRLQIVLDTGTLVGETIDKIDASLATRQMLSARGV